VHRQYEFSSGFLAVVEMADDSHAGHATGTVAMPASRDRSAPRFQGSKEFTVTLTQKSFGEGLARMAQGSEKQERQLYVVQPVSSAWLNPLGFARSSTHDHRRGSATSFVA